jgi:endonuclease/exonuclease/phosphatase family metal-dependent hydrolase
MRRILLTAAATAVVLLGVQPASGATAPSTVGLVSFTAASISGSTASLTINWPDARRADKYEIFMSRSYSMSSAKRFTSTASTKTITGLAKGKDYFFQVRGVNDGTPGNRSQRVGHTTIRAQGTATGPTYRVMTYNLCSEKCSGWSTREPYFLERVRAYNPDVLALQESVTFARDRESFGGYTRASYKSSKSLYYRTDRFEVATHCEEVGEQCTQRTGFVYMGPSRYSVWAELIDKATQRHTIFVSVHTTSGKSDAAALLRKNEVLNLVTALRVINTADLPVVLAGDFNSNKNRSNDYLAGVLHQSGFYDAFDLARMLGRQHYNSYNDFRRVPIYSVKWGDHVDHVWVTPGKTRVLSWANVGRRAGSYYTSPMPSDHNPILVKVQVN